MKILITGATGFLGGWLVSHFLEQNADVICLRNAKSTLGYRDNSQYFLKDLGSKCLEEFVDISVFDDVNSVIKMHQPDVIIHLAAVGDVSVAFNEPRFTYETSANGTLNLLESIRVSSPETFFISHTTDKVYSGNPLPFVEDMSLRPSHIYEAGKIAQEHLTEIYAQSYDIKAVTVRCGNYFGGYDFNFSRIVPYVINQTIKNEAIILRSDGSFTRDFLYIKDAVLVNQMLIDTFNDNEKTLKYGEAFNFSLEIELSVMQIVKHILELCQSDLPIEIHGSASTEIANMRLDCCKAKRDLSWQAHYSLEHGLQETIDFYRHYFKTKN